MQDKKIEKRKQNLIKAIEENPKDLDNHILLGKFYFINQFYKEALETYKKLLEYYPTNVVLLYNTAIAYQADGQIESAKELYLKILKIDPQHKEAMRGIEKITTFK